MRYLLLLFCLPVAAQVAEPSAGQSVWATYRHHFVNSDFPYRLYGLTAQVPQAMPLLKHFFSSASVEVPRWEKPSTPAWMVKSPEGCATFGPLVFRRDPQWYDPMDPQAALKRYTSRPKVGFKLPFGKGFSSDIGGTLSPRKISLRLGIRW